MVENCGAELLANSLMASLVGDNQFTLPDINLSDPKFEIPSSSVGEAPAKLTNENLTTGIVNGSGTFDKVMASMNAHLKAEFEKGRITGEQYTKAYIAVVESSLSNSVQYLLGKDQSYWQAITARLQAETVQIAVVSERVKLQIAKAELQRMRYDALTAEANYALTKLKLSTEDIQFCTAKYNLNNILPEQRLLMIAQRKTTEEGLEAARAQTMDTRTDGTMVKGLLGKQKALYSQQITSYQRDAENKVAKLWSDAWITMKTMDEGLLPPTQFTNANFDGLLTALRARVYLDGSTPPINPGDSGYVDPGSGGDDDPVVV
jgi:hypothetical protein